MKAILAATGEAVARLTPPSQSGAGWQVQLSLTEARPQCLALDPWNPQTVYTGAHGQGLWKSEDGGQTWQNMNLPQKDVFSVAVSPADGSVYAGCEPSRLYQSSDGGQHWKELERLQDIPSRPNWRFPPRPWTSHVRWIAPNPKDPGLLLVGIELGGLMLTPDAGETWFDHRPGAQRDVHSLAWHPLDFTWAYQAGGGGAAWSHTGGRTWEPADAGRDRNYTWAVMPHPQEARTWFISASTGPGAAHGGQNAQAKIYRWRGDGPWESISDEIENPLRSMPYALAFAEGKLWAGMSDGQILVSPDEGESWQTLALHDQPVGRIQAMVCIAD